MSEYNELAEAARAYRKHKGVTPEEERKILLEIETLKRVQDKNRRHSIPETTEGIPGCEVPN